MRGILLQPLSALKDGSWAVLPQDCATDTSPSRSTGQRLGGLAMSLETLGETWPPFRIMAPIYSWLRSSSTAAGILPGLEPLKMRMTPSNGVTGVQWSSSHSLARQHGLRRNIMFLEAALKIMDNGIQRTKIVLDTIAMVTFVKLLLKTQLRIPINSLRLHFLPQPPQPHQPNKMTQAFRSSVIIK